MPCICGSWIIIALPMTMESSMADLLDWFAGRVAVLATMHRKEQAIASIS